MRRVMVALAVVAWGACGGSGDGAAPDAGGPDSTLPDDAGDDTGGAPEDAETVPDVPAEPEPVVIPDTDLCLACDGASPDGDAACGAGNLCLTFTATGESFCAQDCLSTEGLCPPGGVCATIGDGVRQCVPAAGTCEGFVLESVRGQACGEGFPCAGPFPTCAGPGGAPGYCTGACASDRDCGTGFSRCAGGICRADWELGPEGCGYAPGNGAGVGAPCTADTECPGGLCLSDLGGEPLPSSVSPFCSAPCGGDADCGEAARCLPLPEGKRCLPEACDCLSLPGPETLAAEALAALDLHACDAIFVKDRFSYLGDFTRYDPARLSHFQRIHDQPLEVRPWAESLVAAVDGALASEHPVAGAIEEAARRLDRPAAPPETFEAASLADAVAAFAAAAGGTADTSPLASVPASLAAEVAPVVVAMTAFLAAREEALGSFAADPGLRGSLFQFAPAMLTYDPSLQGLALGAPGLLDFLMGGFGYERLYGAARDLALAVESRTWTPDPAWGSFHVVVDTPAGAIVIAGTAADLHEDLPSTGLALLVDAGGDDVYRVPAGATLSPSNAVSIAIDLGGDDDWGYVPSDEGSDDPLRLPDDGSGRYSATSPGFASGPFSFSTTARHGAGILGAGLLFDLGKGDDTYASLRRSQGYGCLGVGALFDGGGNDVYTCEAGCQGSSLFGIGLSVDAGAGQDARLSWTYSQGFAWIRGFGLSADGGGDDNYECVVGDEASWIYYSPQRDKKGNNSMCQGFGHGRRADPPGDGFSLSGGLGVLRDLGGDDRYEADVFDMGGGYWFGTGVLADAAGDDTYLGMYYSQAIGAHFAMGVLLDGAGNDTHNEDVVPGSSIGFAHDASTTLLFDAAGDDLWHAGGLRGYDSGMSVVLELGGNDTYLQTNTLGAADLGPYGDPFPDMLTLGLFVDAGGADTYDAAPAPEVTYGNDALWLWTTLPDRLPGEHGAGIDGEGDPGL